MFRLADALLDLIGCASMSARGGGVLATSAEILHSFRRVLGAVGGQDSTFLGKLHVRMSQLELDSGAWPYRRLPPEEGSTDENRCARSPEVSWSWA